MAKKYFHLIIALMLFSCKTGYHFAESYYKKHNEDLLKVVELYNETSKNQYYVLRINYIGDKAEVLLKPLYPMPDTSPVIVYGSKEWEAEYSKFINEKGRVDANKIDAMIALMKKNRCQEISKGFYNYESSINNFKSYSIALVIKEDNRKLYGLNYYGFNQVYQKENYSELRKIADNVFYYETSKSVFE